MGITVPNTVGGIYFGGSGSPTGSGVNGLNGAIGDVIMISCYSSRAQSAGVFDTHTVAAINVPGGGITFTKIINQAYQYQEASGSFPTCAAHVDVFIGVITATQSNAAFTSTMTGGDTFINDGWFTVHTITGLDTSTILDTAGTNPKIATNVSLTSSTPSVPSVPIAASDSILWFVQFMHTVGAQAIGSPPTGFTVPGTGAGSHFKTDAGGSSAVSSRIDGCISYKLFSSAQGAADYAAASSDNCWFAATIAMRSATAVVANTKRSFAAVVN